MNYGGFTLHFDNYRTANVTISPKSWHTRNKNLRMNFYLKKKKEKKSWRVNPCKSVVTIIIFVNNHFWFIFLVAPVNVTTFTDVVNVTDNRIPPKVTCVAEGRPKPNFRWYNGSANSTFSTNAILSFNEPLSREGSTNFTCEAYNDYGSSTTTLFFNIWCKYFRIIS